MSPETHLPYRLLGGPGSPYSLKLRAILRYRRIHHQWVIPRSYLGRGTELKEAAKGMIPVLKYPDGSYWADSTPIAYDLERRHPGQRSILPPDPGQAFLSHLIEDMADEMLLLPMFDLRWGSDEDQRFCATRQMSGWLTPMPHGELADHLERLTRRQVANRAKWVVGESHDILMDLYPAALAINEAMLDHSSYLFGERPSLADFGLYGQWSQCAIDPSASAIMRRLAPRTYQWTQSLDDASGVEGDWMPAGQISPAVEALVGLAGRYYLPFLLGHAQGVARGLSAFEAQVAGRTWRGTPEPYKLKCLVWLRRELAALPQDTLLWLRPLLQRHGCLDGLQHDALSEVEVPAMAPV